MSTGQMWAWTTEKGIPGGMCIKSIFGRTSR